VRATTFSTRNAAAILRRTQTTEAVVAVSQEDNAFIKAHMAEWLTEQRLGKPAAVYEIELRELRRRACRKCLSQAPKP
jgi:hypothetical protein